MGTVDKEQLFKVRAFLTEHPEEAKKFFEANPEALKGLTGGMVSQKQTEENSNGLQSGNSMGGKQLAKSLPGIPKMFTWDDNGFSNYLMLAVLAFSIQLIITLICIFFYK